jgi:hypothetical protein
MFTSWISGKLCLKAWWLNCFIEYLHRKLLTANFLSYDIESATKKCIYWICILKQLISCSIAMNLILVKKDSAYYWYKSVIFSVEIYVKHIITCYFSYQPSISPRSYIIPLAYRLSGWYHELVLIKGIIWKINNLYVVSIRGKVITYCSIDKGRI